MPAGQQDGGEIRGRDIGAQLARTLGGEMHLDVYLLIDTLAAMALGMFTLMRTEMYLGAKRMLEEARANRAP